MCLRLFESSFFNSNVYKQAKNAIIMIHPIKVIYFFIKKPPFLSSSVLYSYVNNGCQK